MNIKKLVTMLVFAIAMCVVVGCDEVKVEVGVDTTTTQWAPGDSIFLAGLTFINVYGREVDTLDLMYRNLVWYEEQKKLGNEHFNPDENIFNIKTFIKEYRNK